MLKELGFVPGPGKAKGPWQCRVGLTKASVGARIKKCFLVWGSALEVLILETDMSFPVSPVFFADLRSLAFISCRWLSLSALPGPCLSSLADADIIFQRAALLKTAGAQDEPNKAALAAPRNKDSSYSISMMVIQP